MGFGWDIDICREDKEGKCPCCVGHPTPLPLNHRHTPPTVSMVGQCCPFPSLGSPAARHQNQGSSSSRNAAEGRCRASADRAHRLDWTPSFLRPFTPNISVSTRLDRDGPPRPRKTPSNKEDGKPLPLTPPPFSLGGCAVFVFVHPIEEERKKVLGVKKGGSTPALHGSSNSENKHGNRHPPSPSRPLAAAPDPSSRAMPLADQERLFFLLVPPRSLAPGGGANFYYYY